MSLPNYWGPTGISRTTLRGSQHNGKPACSKNVHNFVRRQGLIEEAGSRKTLIGSTCITPRQVAAMDAAERIHPEQSRSV